MEHYFGAYQKFETPGKNEAGILLGADNLVGDLYEIQLKLAEGEHKAWLISRFDQRVGCFDAGFSRRLSVLAAGGLTMKAMLSFVAFTEEGDNSRYWGEMAIFCYDPAYADAFEKFMEGVGVKMQDNVRLRIDLGAEGVQKVLESNGAWLPEQTVPMPSRQKGTVIMKDRRSLSDKMIEQGRQGNKGCYAISWAFIIALVALVVFGIKAIMGW